MKIAVFDSKNKARLLGHLQMNSMPPGYRYEVPMMSPMDMRSLYLFDERPSVSTTHVIVFDIDVRSESKAKQIDAATREITTFERKCFETSASLETLMKLDRFTLPGETEYEARSRRECARYR